MKKIKSIISLCIITTLLTLSITSCQQPTGGDEQKDIQQTEQQTPEQLMEEAISTINIPKVINADTNLINLPVSFTDEKYKDIKITWTSEDKTIISNGGNVTHKDSDKEEAAKLTAILRYNNSIVSKSFNVTVKNQPFTENQKKLNEAVKSFTVEIHNEIKKDIKSFNIELPSVIPNDDIPNEEIKITWQSSDPSIINLETKEVKHSESLSDDNVEIIAVFKYKNVTAVKTFPVKVECAPNDEQIVDYAITKFNISNTEIPTELNYIYLDNKKQTPYGDVEIAWVTNNQNIISKTEENTYYDVKHTAKAGTQYVKLTATFSKGSVQKNKDFVITVLNPDKTPQELQDENDTIIIDKAVTKLTITTEVTEYVESIQLPNSLPEAEFNGVEITWKSDNKEVITDNGKITHTMGSQPDTIKLTATLKKGNINKTKEFTVTVKHPEKTITADEILNAAITTLECPVFTSTELSAAINLPAVQKIEENEVNVTWKLLTTDNHFSLSGNTLNLTRDLSELKGKIQATLTFNDTSKTKDFEIVIPAYTQFDNAKIINGNILEYETGAHEKHRYEIKDLNIKDKTMSLKWTDRKTSKGWESVEGYRSKKVKEFTEIKNSIKKAESNPTLANIKVAIKLTNSMYDQYGRYDFSKEETYYNIMIEDGCYTTGDVKLSLEEAMKLTDENEETKTAIKKEIECLKSIFITDEDISCWEKNIDAKIANMKEEEFIPARYNIIDKNTIKIKTAYDISKKWHEQRGWFESTDHSTQIKANTKEFRYTPTGKSMKYLYFRVITDKQIEVYKSSQPEQIDSTWTVILNSDNSINVKKDTYDINLIFTGENIKTDFDWHI